MEWIVFKTNQKKPASEIAYKKLSSKNKEAINKWLHEKSVLSKSEKRAKNRKRTIVKLLTFIKKDFDKITYEDYVNVASALSRSQNGTKQKNGDRYFIGRFIKDNYENWEKKFKGLKLLKNEKENDEGKLKPEELLTELEIDKLMRTTSDMKKISLIAVLYTSAARPEEILKLRWCDVDFKSKLIYLYSAKTGKRRAVPIDSAIQHLQRLKEEIEAQEQDLVFPSVSKKIMTGAGLNFMLKELAVKAKIKKRIFSYLFRHTRLSYLITKLSPKVYENVAGHSLEMGMRTYAHLSQDAIIKEMQEKVFEVKEMKEETKEEYEARIKVLEKQVRNFKSDFVSKEMFNQIWSEAKLK